MVRNGPIAARFAGPAFAIMIAIGASGGAAQAAEDDFYKGKQIRLVISSGPAGVYDTFARLIARFLPAHGDRAGRASADAAQCRPCAADPDRRPVGPAPAPSPAGARAGVSHRAPGPSAGPT